MLVYKPSKESINIIVAFLCMLASISLFVFICALILNLFFKVQYDMPAFIAVMLYWLDTYYNISGFFSYFLILIPFVVLCLLLFYLSKYMAGDMSIKNENKLQEDQSDNNLELLFDDPVAYEARQYSNKNTLQIILILVALVVGSLLALWLLQYFIFVDMSAVEG